MDYSDKINVYAITPQFIAKSQPAVLPKANPSLDQAMADYEYTVGPGDVLRVTVWDHPELSSGMASSALSPAPAGGEKGGGSAGRGGAAALAQAASSASAAQSGGQGFVVDADGTIYFPYVGTLKVSGMTARQIRVALTEALSRYLVKPQLDVSVMAFRAHRVYVTGEVAQPGALPLTDMPMTLLDAVNQAGGLLASADWEKVVLTRNGRQTVFSLDDLYRHGNTEQNILLQGGDVVYVSRSDGNKVFVLGEVRQAHSLPVRPEGITLAEALSDSGGINELTSDASGVFVLRRTSNPTSGKLIDIYQLNIKDATGLVLAEEFSLQPRDIVYVTAAPLERWNKVISLILPSLTGLYFESLSGQNISNTNY